MTAPAPLVWDFEPRSVAVSLSVRATFHPSVGSASVSLPWLDAAGTFSASASTGPLSSCLVEAGDPNFSRDVGRHPGSVCAFWEQAATPVNVSFELIRRLQNKALPVSVSLAKPDGSATEVSSSARVHLGPLLLKGSSSAKESQVEEGAVRPARSPYEVFATWTETVGIAGLFRLEVRVWSEEPLLTQAMRERLVPACFMVEAVRSLPNEDSLSETCEDIYIQVYPQLGSATGSWLAEECKKVRSKGRPHDTIARFNEPVVWLLGLAPQHVVREWLHHQGLVVEVHDRDKKPPEPPEGSKDAEAEEAVEENVKPGKADKGKDKDKGKGKDADKGKGKDKDKGKGKEPEKDPDEEDGEEDKKKPQIVHPHGIARFPLAMLLGKGCLKVPLRADVFPSRGDKKRRRAERLIQDINTKSLLESEANNAFSMDKREDTPAYHECGTFCTITAALGAPLPEAADLLAQDEGKLARHWAGSEQRVNPEGNVWVATTPPGAPVAVDPRWCPRSRPYRAKLPLPTGEEAVGPWRAQKEDAEADEALLKSALGEGDVDAAHAAVKDLQEGLKASPEVSLDCRYERFGRAVLVVDERETEAIKAVLGTVRAHNAKVLGISASSVQLDTHELTAQQKTDPHLDLITGFSLLDGRSRLMVVEGLRGRGFQALIDAVPRNGRRNCPEFKMLHNPSVGFNQRLYLDCGPTVRQIKIRFSLESLASKPEVYSVTGIEDDEMKAGLEAPKLLMSLKQTARLHSLREGGHFPRMANLVALNVLFGAHISDEELQGEPARPPTKASQTAKQPQQQQPQQQQDTGVSEETLVTTRRSMAMVASRCESADIRFLEEAAAVPELGGESPDQIRIKVTRKGITDQRNPAFTQSLDFRRSCSVPDFGRKNREAIFERSQENMMVNDILGKKRERETPFLDGKEVFNYSGQKLNCTETQKEWMRSHMEGEKGSKVWSYNAAYNTGTFEFAGAEEPGVKLNQSIKPNDTYARQHGDDRPVFRSGGPARPKEEYRKPVHDVDPSRREMLHEAFVENEWHRVPVSESRSQPVATEVYFEADKIPHHRRITHRPFDPTRSGPKAANFGPVTSFESVHYHGRPPGEDLGREILDHNKREKELAATKIMGSTTMRSFSQTNTRQGITDLDRHESLAKDKAPHQGSFSSTLRTSEVYHDCGEGRPDQEWHARLRENDSSPPFEVHTGTYLKRDRNVGTKQASMSGKLGKAPWRHDSYGVPKGSREYPSAHDFNLTRPPPRSRLCENQTWKNSSRTSISAAERSASLPYLRPAHYGVSLLT